MGNIHLNRSIIRSALWTFRPESLFETTSRLQVCFTYKGSAAYSFRKSRYINVLRATRPQTTFYQHFPAVSCFSNAKSLPCEKNITFTPAAPDRREDRAVCLRGIKGRDWFQKQKTWNPPKKISSGQSEGLAAGHLAKGVAIAGNEAQRLLLVFLTMVDYINSVYGGDRVPAAPEPGCGGAIQRRSLPKKEVEPP